MICLEFEDLLLRWEDLDESARQALDAHLSVCEHCAEFREALRTADAELEQAFAGIAARPGFEAAVLRRIRTRPVSIVPEILDGIAWLSLCAGLVLPVRWLLPETLSPIYLGAACAPALALALWLGYHSLLEFDA